MTLSLENRIEQFIFDINAAAARAGLVNTDGSTFRFEDLNMQHQTAFEITPDGPNAGKQMAFINLSAYLIPKV